MERIVSVMAITSLYSITMGNLKGSGSSSYQVGESGKTQTRISNPSLMATRFCSFCGKPLPSTGTFCPSCGAAIPVASPSAGPVGPIPGPAPGPFPMPGYGAAGARAAAPGPSPASRAEDLRSLSWVEWAAMMGLLSAVISIVVELFGRLAGLVAVTRTPTGRSPSLPSPEFWAVLLGVGGAIALLEIFLWRAAFRGLSPVDSRFSTPATLALVAAIGTVLVFVGLAVFFDALYRTVQCDGPGNPITTACIPLGEFFGGGVVALVGGLAALVGLIGILIGVWRLGTRYGDGVFKVSAILLIFPIVSFVGAILILYSAHSHRNRVAAMANAPVPAGAR